MHLCRSLFPTLLETEGLLFELISNKYAPTKGLYSDIVNNDLIEKFKEYIYKLNDIDEKIEYVDKTPQELMDDAGYILYECKTIEDVKFFKKYYKENELLCTFDDIEGRLNRDYIFWAVKKNVEDIKREDFNEPKRQDEYGTSVISIQFSKGSKNILSIKNRYNHTVQNSDATFSNNLDEIIPGLKQSFNNYFNFDIIQNDLGFEIPNYVKAVDGKFYRYNYELDNIYYCDNNVIIDNFEFVRDYEDKSRFIVFDYFILDLEKHIGHNNSIKFYDEKLDDSFPNTIKDIRNIEITKEQGTGNRIISLKNAEGIIQIKIDNLNRMIGYKNNIIKKIPYNFLYDNKYLKEIEINNAISIDSYFMYSNNSLEKLYLPKAFIIYDYLLYYNRKLKIFDALRLENMGNACLYNNRELEILNAPNIENIGDYSLMNNIALKELSLLKLKNLGIGFLRHNEKLDFFEAPNIEHIESGCFEHNKHIDSYELLISRQKVKIK